jgi:hypothetical protein
VSAENVWREQAWKEIAELHRASVGFSRPSWSEIAECLLPLVQQIADQRAAEELRAAATEAHSEAYTERRLPWEVIRARADALDPL